MARDIPEPTFIEFGSVAKVPIRVAEDLGWQRVVEFLRSRKLLEVHAYAVKRPYGTYWYNKLAAHRDLFYPQAQQRLVRHIHLGKTGEPRHREAQAEIERRNQLVKPRTQLMTAAKALDEALSILQNPHS